jgi:hypothetical protein
VRNPWSELPGQTPYVLQIDGTSIDRYNTLHNSDEKIIVESLPEPFIGNPQSAKVVLLNLNPGHSEDDAKAHSDAGLQGAMIRNLRHEPQDYPSMDLIRPSLGPDAGFGGGRTRADCMRLVFLGKQFLTDCS